MPLAAVPSPLPEPAFDRLRAQLYVETDLDGLVALFAAAIAEEGFSGHLVVDAAADGGLNALFGDSPGLLSSVGARSIVVGSDVAPDRAMLLAGGAGQPPSSRVRGFATLYAARGSTLLELRRDVATLSPLTLMQRIIFARMLAGEPAIDVGIALGLSTAAVMTHVDRATATIKARNSASAVAEAARKGWLVAIPRNFGFPADKKVG